MNRLAFTLLVSALAWGGSSIGYFELATFLRADIGYNDAPLFYAGYYALWALAVAYVFRQSFQSFTNFDIPPEHIAGFALLLIFFAAYAMFVVPQLPAMEWVKPDKTPVEFFDATSWYFLPKSVEILFQQILIAALVLALHQMQISLPRIMAIVALMFGGFHLTLALNGDNPFYVLRYSVAAMIFGAFAPYILLKLRSGFLITYAIHWTYYAIDFTLIHFYFSANA
jgi:hypothetical protein